MRIPEIKERLHDIAKVLYAEDMDDIGSELDMLAMELSRRPAISKAPKASASVTDELAEQIRSYAAKNKNATQMQMAIRFKVNSGRISEVLRGKRS